MQILKNLLLIISFGAACISVPGQKPNEIPAAVINKQSEEPDLSRRTDNAARNAARAAYYPRIEDTNQVYTRSSRGYVPDLAEERARVKKLLTPDANIKAQYKSFLKQKHTGLFRLFPDLNCEESRIVVRVDGDCAGIVPGSWRYSFRQKDYQTADFADVQLKDGNLTSKGFLAQGIIVKLGDVAAENISPATAGLKFLLEYNPAAALEGAKKQFAEISRGIEAHGFNYVNKLSVAENTTYALRVIAYRNEIHIGGLMDKIGVDDTKFINVNFDKRIDLTVVFRIVKKDDDGSLTILWKEISSRQSPKIIFRKNDKLSDIK